MMRKLNNKGISTAEILVCFVIIVLVSSSVYTIVSSYQNKQHIASIKEKIVTYKNLLTKEINDDIIKMGLQSVDIPDDSEMMRLVFKNGETRILKVNRINASPNIWDENYNGTPSCENEGGCKEDAETFEICYGKSDLTVVPPIKPVCYPLPDVGSTYNTKDYPEKIFDLRLLKPIFSDYNNVLSINIRFYHPELGYKYGIDIVSPIGFDS